MEAGVGKIILEVSLHIAQRQVSGGEIQCHLRWAVMEAWIRAQQQVVLAVGGGVRDFHQEGRENRDKGVECDQGERRTSI